MSDFTTRQHVAKSYPLTGPDDLVMMPPAVMEVATTQPATTEANLGFVLTVANLMLTALLITGMLIKGSAVQTALLIGGTYFAATTIAFVFVITGALTAMVNSWQRETTERLRVEAWRELGAMAIEWRLAVEETRQMELGGRRPAASVERVSPLTTYVAPVADGEAAQVEGVRFAMGLYDTRGRPDPKRLHADGRLKIRMIGSKRGSGSRDAGRWLLRAGIIRRVRGGYALDISRYPTRDSLRHYL